MIKARFLYKILFCIVPFLGTSREKDCDLLGKFKGYFVDYYK